MTILEKQKPFPFVFYRPQVLKSSEEGESHKRRNTETAKTKPELRPETPKKVDKKVWLTFFYFTKTKYRSFPQKGNISHTIIS